MSRSSRTILILFVVLSLLLTGCSPTGAPSPGLSLTASPILPAVPAPTRTPLPPTATPLPTHSPADLLNLEWVEQLAPSADLLSRPGGYYVGAGQLLWVRRDWGSVTSPLVLPGPIQDLYEDFGSSRRFVFAAVEGSGILIAVYTNGTTLERAGLLFTDIRHPRTVVVKGPCFDALCVPGSSKVLAYVASPQEGFFILDVTNRTYPLLASRYQEAQAMAAAVQGGYAYVTDARGGLWVLDVSDPKAPRKVGFVETPSAQDVAVEGSSAYLAAGAAGLVVVDVSDPAGPTVVGSLHTTPAGFPQGEANSITVEKGRWLNAGPNFAYLTLGAAGLWIVDVTDPATPVSAGFYRTHGMATRVTVSGEMVRLAAGAEGLVTLHFTPPPRGTRWGSFTLTRLLDPSTPVGLPPMKRPGWLRLAEGEEEALARVEAAYEPLVHPPGGPYDTVAPYDSVAPYLDPFIAAVDDFRQEFPDGDGAIPVLMMSGHLDAKTCPSPLCSQAYDEAINLLLQRHPDRLPFLLDDLVDMGMLISYLQSVRLNGDGPEALIFIHDADRFWGENTLFTLLQQPGETWAVLPLRPQYGYTDWDYGSSVETIDDINDDGETELVLRLRHRYASAEGFCLAVFGWHDGAWQSRLDWDPRGRPEGGDATEPGYWMEDMNQDGTQEIVVYYEIGRHYSGKDTVEIYQWDPSSATYTNTLPIAAPTCGYQTYAEAERHRTLGDWEGALPWYQEAAQLLQAEQQAGSPCLVHLRSVDVRDLLEMAQEPEKIEE